MAEAAKATSDAVIRYEQTLREKIQQISDNGPVEKQKLLLKKMFIAMDKGEKDDSLSYEEFRKIGTDKLNFVGIPEVRMQHWFTKYDVDGSGSLSLEEFINGVIMKCEPKPFMPKPSNLRLSSKVNGPPKEKFVEAYGAIKALSTGDGFKKIDGNGNGNISLAEVDMWVRGAVPILNNKKALLQAHKNCCGSDGLVQANEFEQLCKNIVTYNRLFQCFSLVDTGADKRVEEKEFIAALNYLNFQPPLKPQEAVAAFRGLDTNKSGNIMFDEFCEFFIKGQPSPW